MKKSLIALAFGTLGLGIAEFVMMGILPDVAHDFGISISQAGHFISAYALGVCVGAPMLILARKHPLKRILLILVTLIMVGNISAALAPNYWILLLARFISGLPHGAYFGVGSIVAEKLADKGKGSEAVSIMVAGMTIANLFGVPLGTSLSAAISWRVTFLLVGCWGMIILYYIWRWVPQIESLPDTGLKGQFRFLKSPAPWLLIGATLLGNGGVFCWYSYINPLLTHVSGFHPQSITFLMVLAGFGMVVGSGSYRTGMHLRHTIANFLFIIRFVAVRIADVSLYGRTVCPLQSATSLADTLFKRRRDVGSSQRTGGIQFGKRNRCLLRRIGIASRTWLSISCIDRCPFRFCRIYTADCISQEI